MKRIIAIIFGFAHTGKSGDGKIFTSPVEGAIQISTGQRGDDAI